MVMESGTAEFGGGVSKQNNGLGMLLSRMFCVYHEPGSAGTQEGG